MNLTDLEAFVRVVELGTITAAARAMSLPKSTVSRRVARLEDALGVSLLTRASRSVGLTETGRLLYARSAPALRELADTQRALLDAAAVPQGLLRLTALPDMGSTRAFTELILAFRARYPRVRVELLLTGRVVDLIQEGVDVALRPMGRAATGDGLMMRRLSDLRGQLYASPRWLDAHGRPAHPRELDRRLEVVHQVLLGRGPVLLEHADGGERHTLELGEPGFVTNDFNQMLAALMAGAGPSLVPAFHAAPWLESAALELVLPDWSFGAGQLALVWPESRHMAPRVRAFIDFFTETLRPGGRC